jgi:diguanylate cyclase (GGDEF)-like protein
VARLGGDEFVVFPLEVSSDALPALVARLHQRLEEYNSQGLEPFKVSMSVGFGHYNPDECKSVEDLLAAADAGLYRTKQERHGASGRDPLPDAG